MEVGEVRVIHRETVTYNVQVVSPSAIITLNVDDSGRVNVFGRYQEEGMRFRLAEFNSAYLRQVYAAIGAVLEAMGEGRDE